MVERDGGEVTWLDVAAQVVAGALVGVGAYWFGRRSGERFRDSSLETRCESLDDGPDGDGCTRCTLDAGHPGPHGHSGIWWK